MSRVGLLALLLALIPLGVQAQGAASGLYGVKEVVVQYAHFTDPKAADSCGLSRENVATVLNKYLKDDNVPAIAVADVKPSMTGVMRINLVPEIATVNYQGFDCISWVSLAAQGQSNVLVPPSDTLRSVTITYWHQGAMVVSGQSAHDRLVGEMVQKMAKQFAQQYRLDQPPQIVP